MAVDLAGPDLDHDIAMAGAAVEVVERGAAALARGADQVADLRRPLVGRCGMKAAPGRRARSTMRST